jgi:hypothetical protein
MRMRVYAYTMRTVCVYTRVRVQYAYSTRTVRVYRTAYYDTRISAHRFLRVERISLANIRLRYSRIRLRSHTLAYARIRSYTRYMRYMRTRTAYTRIYAHDPMRIRAYTRTMSGLAYMPEAGASPGHAESAWPEYTRVVAYIRIRTRAYSGRTAGVQRACA